MSFILSFSSSLLAINEYEEEEDYYYNNIYAGYGVGSGPQIITGILDTLAFAFTTSFSGSKSIETRDVIGPIFLGADYFPVDYVSVGGLFVYDAFTRRWTYSDGGYADWNWSFISLMGRINLQWGWDYLKFYHSIMLGGSRVGIDLQQSDGQHEHNSSEYTWAGHVVLLGIKVGKEFKVFADFGVGYLGMINFGASFSF
ncbi:MAG TPA: hypothetical protein PK514_04340 [Spirochaetota bacterium]|nr:hypothetical protein [Spirochaetota bacterium]